MDKFDIEKFPTSESAKNMLHSISEDFYEKSYVMKWLLQVMGLEWDEAKRIIIEELPQQLFIETATWGLMFHEQKWQLPVKENLSYEERRRLIYQRRDFKAPMTPYKMEIYLKNVTGFDVHVLDCHDSGEYDFTPKHPNIFKVIFVGDGTLDAKSVRKLLNKIKQSHTVYTICEMVIVVVDHKDLEQIQLHKLNLQTSFCDNVGEIAASQTLRAEVNSFTESIEASVTTLKNAWYFDGTFGFDGEKQFNAEVKKEVL